MINNARMEKPRITIKRDNLLKGGDFEHDVVLNVGGELVEEISKRNRISKPSEEPIYVHYEYRFAPNVTVIDTPGLLKDDEGDVTGGTGGGTAGTASARAELQAIAYNLLKIPERIILCVEESKDWDKLDMLDLIKQVDPEFTRTTFVYTKFHFHLSRFTSTRHTNRYLQGALPPDIARCFFTSLLPSRVRAKFPDSQPFQLKLHQAIARDLRALEQLQYDRR